MNKNKKAFYNLIIPKTTITIIFVSLFLYALMCINFNLQVSANEFIIKFYNLLNTFLIHVPLIISLIIYSYRKFYNDLIIIRFESQIKLFKAEITLAFLISIIYVFMIALLEIVFISLAQIPNKIFNFIFLISVFIQILTIFFVLTLYIMLRKISKSNTVSIIIIIIILGIDTYTTIVRTPFIPYSFNLFISPMCTIAEYVLNGSLGLYYYLWFSLLKVAVVITINYLYIYTTRRDYVAKK